MTHSHWTCLLVCLGSSCLSRVRPRGSISYTKSIKLKLRNQDGANVSSQVQLQLISATDPGAHICESFPVYPLKMKRRGTNGINVSLFLDHFVNSEAFSLPAPTLCRRRESVRIQQGAAALTGSVKAAGEEEAAGSAHTAADLQLRSHLNLSVLDHLRRVTT